MGVEYLTSVELCLCCVGRRTQEEPEKRHVGTRKSVWAAYLLSRS